MADLYRDPERLRVHAARAEELADLLRVRAGYGPGGWPGSPVVRGVEELTAAFAAAAAELTELAGQLRGAAERAETADRELRRDLGRRIGPA